MKVLVAMSGGVDSSVAAALLLEQGHEVTGATMRLWGGPSDTGCCSVADVDDARRVAQQLGIDHFVFNFSAAFQAGVVDPYVDSHVGGHTPNPCVECNRTIKFDRFARRAEALGFDAIATGHHARVTTENGAWTLRRGVDAAKDQSYVLHMLDQAVLSRTLLPVGELTKADVRDRATAMGLRTAAKPDSQDVCFITRGGRAAFLADRVALTRGVLVDTVGEAVGHVPAIQLVTVGQRRGLGLGGGGEARYALAVDTAAGTVTVGQAADLAVDRLQVASMAWTDGAVEGRVLVQTSAHGQPRPATVEPSGAGVRVKLDAPARRVAPGQSVVLYDGDRVLGGGAAG
ncbi:MAG TPA: tRNA 2-thiouridine(34) synthase MnmA [Acidimicrobiales bacterium]